MQKCYHTQQNIRKNVTLELFNANIHCNMIVAPLDMMQKSIASNKNIQVFISSGNEIFLLIQQEVQEILCAFFISIKILIPFN